MSCIPVLIYLLFNGYCDVFLDFDEDFQLAYVALCYTKVVSWKMEKRRYTKLTSCMLVFV